VHKKGIKKKKQGGLLPPALHIGGGIQKNSQRTVIPGGKKKSFQSHQREDQGKTATVFLKRGRVLAEKIDGAGEG